MVAKFKDFAGCSTGSPGSDSAHNGTKYVATVVENDHLCSLCPSMMQKESSKPSGIPSFNVELIGSTRHTNLLNVAMVGSAAPT